MKSSPFPKAIKLVLLLCAFLRYHLKDVIVGKIYFLLVRIKIQHMELQLIKKEITGIGKKARLTALYHL